MIRTHHTTDFVPDELAPRQRRRVIGNWINYRSPSGLWAPTAPGLAVASEHRPVFTGAGAPIFSRGSEAAPLQFWSGDTSDPSNTTTVAISSDTKPDVTYAVTLDAPDAVVAMQEDGATVSWPGVVTNGTLRWIHAGHIARKEIELSGPGHAFAWRFKIRLSPGATFELADNAYTIRAPTGDAVFVGIAPYGYDAGGSIEGNRIACTLTQVDTWGPGGAWPIVELAANPADFEQPGFTYPATIDPTSSITGTTNLDDTMLLQGASGNNNYGIEQAPSFVYSATTMRKILVRIASGAIPDGTIDAATWYWFKQNSRNSFVYNLNKVSAANAGWVEGTVTASSEEGSVCWNYQAYSATTPTNWAGSAGCSTSGTDYETDASPPTFTETDTNPGWRSLGLKTAWVSDWRDTPANNAGFIVNPQPPATGTITLYATEFSATQLYVDIDYTTSAAAVYFYHRQMMGA